MSEASKPAGHPLDSIIKYAGALLGITTAALSLYIAVTSRETNERLASTNEKLASTKAEVEKLNLASTQYDLAARVIAEFGAQNAREFAATLRQKRTAVDIPDPDLRQQLVEGSKSWESGGHLMTGYGPTGLYLRQIIYLKLTSLGKTAATDLRLVVRQKDFELKQGTDVKRYGALDTKSAGWVERTLPLSALMESSAESRNMRTQVLIPLAQVSGGQYYFGRVLVPVKLLWRDRRLDREQAVDLDVAQESTLDNQLDSAILGRSTTTPP